MAVFLTSTNRFSNLVKREFEPEDGYCRDVVTMNDAAATLDIGTVVGKYLASPTATAGAIVGTGNGAIGTITATSVSSLATGVYTLKVVKAVANAGDFVVIDIHGDVMGNGSVGTAFSSGGLAFTLADGATDFAVGDMIPITVAGTTKWKLVEATATDGSQVAAGIIIGDNTGFSRSVTLPANTDTKVLILARGPAEVSKSVLTFGASVDTAGELSSAYSQLKALGIMVETTV